MKRAYSDFTFCDVVKYANKMAFGAKEAEAYFRQSLLSSGVARHREEIEAWTSILDCELACLSGAATHLFIDRALYDWLIDRSPDVDPDPDWLRELVDMRTINGKTAENPVMVHISGGRSPCFVILSDQDGKMKFLMSHSTKKEVVEQQYDECENFTRGLAAYCRCFSGVIKDGVPEDLKHAPRYKGTAKTARLHHDISGGGVTPHFRCGHFRRLTSDQFTKKRGQIVFVRETFVKGQAKHVTERSEHVAASDVS